MVKINWFPDQMVKKYAEKIIEALPDEIKNEITLKFKNTSYTLKTYDLLTQNKEELFSIPGVIWYLNSAKSNTYQKSKSHVNDLSRINDKNLKPYYKKKTKSLYGYMSSDLRHELISSLNVSVCPYCNRQYITSWNSDEKVRTTADLDHFYSKSKYPLFSLSLFNLVPSCQICNSRFKGKNAREESVLPIYPYTESFGDDGIFVLKRQADNTNGQNNNDSIDGENENNIDKKLELKFLLGFYEEGCFDLELEINPDSKNANKIKESNRLFHLNEVYKTHLKYALRLRQKQAIYDDGSYLKMLKAQFEKNNLSFTEDELEEFLYGYRWQNGEDPDRPLSKLTYDILKR